MNNFPRPLYSDITYEGSPYIIELYEDGSIHIVSSQKRVIFNVQEVLKYFYELGYFEILFPRDHFPKGTDLTNFKKYISVLEEKFKSIDQLALSPPPIDRETIESKLIELYKNLYNSIEKAYEISQRNGKKLLIVAGEEHTSMSSLVIELILTKICLDLKIKNLMLESNRYKPSNKFKALQGISTHIQPDDPLTKQISSYHQMQKEYFASYLGINIISEITYNSNFFTVHYIDPLSAIYRIYNTFSWREFSLGKACGWQTRAEEINKSIAKVNQSALLIVGTAHLKDICTNKELQNIYQIIAINSSNYVQSQDLDPEKLKFLDKVSKARIEAKLKNDWAKFHDKENVNLDEYNKYIEDKKNNGILADQMLYPHSSQILQAFLEIGKFTNFELCKSAINTMNYYDKSHNVESRQYSDYLTEFLLTNTRKDLKHIVERYIFADVLNQIADPEEVIPSGDSKSEAPIY